MIDGVTGGAPHNFLDTGFSVTNEATIGGKSAWGDSMKCLWLTLADPEPAVNGQFIYSAGLINAMAALGAELSVVGLSRASSGHRSAEGRIRWHLASEPSRRSKASKVLSSVPLVSFLSMAPGIERAIETCLRDDDPETVVFDSISMGWALPIVLRRRRTRAFKLVYLAHNHEITVARQIAASATGLKGAGLAFDALKVVQLERRLVANADLVTSNDPGDCEKFEAMAPRNPVVFLPPGYGGEFIRTRTLDGGLPRRAIVVGSFNFPPKRHSLEAFLTIAEPVLSAAGIELQIVGGAEESYLASLRRRFQTVEFTGAVPDVRPFMANARVALVPDQLGGFKLKALDYVFNRAPILAMDIAVPGTPLENGASIRLFSNHRALADGVVTIIDDLPTLNRQQNLAFDACVSSFAWDTVGKRLLEGIRHLPAA